MIESVVRIQVVLVTNKMPFDLFYFGGTTNGDPAWALTKLVEQTEVPLGRHLLIFKIQNREGWQAAAFLHLNAIAK